MKPTTRSKNAIEQLRASVVAARDQAGASLRDKTLEELAALVERHQTGTSITGWKNPYPITDPRNLLLEYQFADFHDHSRFKAKLQARQTGKDFTGQGEIVDDCLASPSRDWMVGAPSERQALDSLDQGRLWAEAFDTVIEDYIEDRPGHPQALLKSAEIIFPNKSRIRAVPGKPDTVRGRSCNVFLTEFDFFENPQATWRAILPSITNPLRGGEKKVRIGTTPNGKGGAMHRIWTKPDTPRMAWSRHLVTIYHAVLMGLPVDVAQLREALDDELGWQQEFLCQFLDGSAVLLPYDIIALAESLEATEAVESGFWTSGRQYVCGIDFGRTTDPTVCWTLEGFGSTWLTREVLVLENMPTDQQEEILRPRVRGAARVCIDYTGPGIGLGDYLVKAAGEYAPRHHKLGRVELCTFTTALKREIFPRLRRAFEAPTKLRIPYSIAIREDLHAMQQKISGGTISYDSPRTSAGHSDRCVALALANRATDTVGGSTWLPVAFPPRGQRSRAKRERTLA
jgi:phage FluMu gp28-like protein